MSSSKTRYKNKRIFVDGAMASTNTINSSEVDISGGQMVSLNISWTGTPNGTFAVQIPATFSTDGLDTVLTWATLPVVTTSGSAFTAAGSASSHQVEITAIAASRIRLQYVNSSSSGTLNAWLTLKGE